MLIFLINKSRKREKNEANIFGKRFYCLMVFGQGCGDSPCGDFRLESFIAVANGLGIILWSKLSLHYSGC